MKEEQEILKNKRKSSHNQECQQVSKRLLEHQEYDEEEDDEGLTLSLSYGPRTKTTRVNEATEEEPLYSTPPSAPPAVAFTNLQDDDVGVDQRRLHFTLESPISQSPLQLSASHPLYSISSEPISSSILVDPFFAYPQLETSAATSFSFVPNFVNYHQESTVTSSPSSLSVVVPAGTGGSTTTGNVVQNNNPHEHLLSSSVPNFIFPQEITVPTSSSSSTLSVMAPNYATSRGRKNTTPAPREGKTETVPAPFPWSTTHRATVHSIEYLFSKQIFTITGDVQCKRCEQPYEISYDLKTKFAEIGSFIAEKKNAMHERAPSVWMNPVLPKCKYCHQENSVKPVISLKKKSINWLFLLLGQMLGCCTLDQLKYFCKHTQNHRTGAKDRVLFLTYLGLCKQLDPKGPFNR